MHRIKEIVFALSAFISFASTAGAMPLAPLDQSQTGFIVQIEGGCGPGFHRGPFGGCRPNRPVVVAPAAPVVVAPAAPVVVAPCQRVCDAFRSWRTCR
jgi:hypothetical protein